MVVRWLHRQARLLTLSAVVVPGLTAIPAPAVAQDSVPVSSSAPGRRLAADAYYVIPPGAEYGDTFEGPVDLPLMTPESELEWGPPKFPENRPNYAPASETLLAKTKNVIFRRKVWSLEFGFKPVRMIEVEMPDADGKMETKLVWYLLYYVRYLGGDLTPSAAKDSFGNEVFGMPTPTDSPKAPTFIPGFVMNCTALGERYQSRFLPHALAPIAEKERVGRPVYDSIAIQKVPVPLTTRRESHPVWGVATWTDVDPRTDFFSIEIRGLTNAQRIENADGKLNFKQKTLVLNFSRPGDTFNEIEDQIRYGVPAVADEQQQKDILRKYGIQERLDHYWVYR
ncbi:MAG: hypothetical protein ACTHOU_15700 [Aureliella sp.]